ncbi:hypothetical protein F5Y09DRAFT_340228 [Xylaria sp. FL1042]|nr:hypothetical protein F5Y09DRAFT_340228 [Xylaria sp. FL1042]
MSSQLNLLKSNAVLIGPTLDVPYYSIKMTNAETGCELRIAALKPFRNPILNIKIVPREYVSYKHKKDECNCASFTKTANSLFKTWQEIHLKLRKDPKDNASYAFYPEFEYEEGEGLAHASLVASLGLGKPIPECYESLIEKFGAPNLQKSDDDAVEEFFDAGYVSSGDSDVSDSDRSDDSDPGPGALSTAVRDFYIARHVSSNDSDDSDSNRSSDSDGSDSADSDDSDPGPGALSTAFR